MIEFLFRHIYLWWMFFSCRILVQFLCLINNGIFIDNFETPEAAKTASGGPLSVVPASHWPHDFDKLGTSQAASYPGFSSFEGRQVSTCDQDGGTRQLCLDVSLRSPMWQTPRKLPCLQARLEVREASFESTQGAAQVTESRLHHPSGRLVLLGMDLRWTCSQFRSFRSSAQFKFEETKSWQRAEQPKGKGQGRNCLSLWSVLYSSMALSRYHLCVSSSICSATGCFYGNGLPELGRCRVDDGCQRAVSGHHQSIGQDSSCCRKSRESQCATVADRSTQVFAGGWGCHSRIAEFAGSSGQTPGQMAQTPARCSPKLGETVEAVHGPAKQLSQLIKKAKSDLTAARQTLEVLNKKAAGPEDLDDDPADLDDPSTAEAESQALVMQVQQVLHACAKAAVKEEPMEISDAEEQPPASKRPRSLEPFGGQSAPS